MHNEEVCSGLAGLGEQQRDDDCHVAHHDGDEQDPHHRELLRLAAERVGT